MIELAAGPVRSCILRIGTDVYDLDETQCTHVAIIDSREPTMLRRIDGTPYARFHSYPDTRQGELGLIIDTDTQRQLADAIRGHAGTIDVFYRAGEGRSYLEAGVTDPGQIRTMIISGNYQVDTLAIGLEGRLRYGVPPLTWDAVVSSEICDLLVSGADPVVMIHDPETDVWVYFDEAELRTTNVMTYWVDGALHANQLRTNWSVHRKTGFFPLLSFAVYPAHDSTRFKVDYLIDNYRTLEVYNLTEADSDSMIEAFALPTRRLEYRCGYPSTMLDADGDAVLTQAMQFIGVRPEAGETPTQVSLVVTTGNDWRGIGSTQVDMEGAAAQDGPDGPDDTAGVLTLGQSEAITVAKWGTTTESAAALSVAEFGGEVWGFFATQITSAEYTAGHPEEGYYANVKGTNPQGCKVARWDADAADWVDWQTLSTSWYWYWGLSALYNNNRGIQPAVATTADGIWAISSGSIAAGWMLWHYDGITWHQELPALGGTTTGERIMSLYAAQDGALLIGGTDYSAPWWHARIWRYADGSLDSVYVGSPWLATWGNPEITCGCYSFGIYGAAYYCAGGCIDPSGAGWHGILISEDGTTWAQEHQCSFPGHAAYSNAQLSCVVLVDRIMWIGTDETATDWVYLDAEGWHDRDLTDPDMGIVYGCAPTIEMALFLGWAYGERTTFLYLSALTLDSWDPTIFMYGGIAQFNRTYGSLGFSPRISTGIWCGGTDFDGHACFWGIASAGQPDGFWSRVDDAGQSVAWDRLTMTANLPQGTLRTLVAAADNPTLLPTGSNGYPYSEADVVDGEAVIGLLGRYLKRRLEWTGATEPGEIDDITVEGTA